MTKNLPDQYSKTLVFLGRFRADRPQDRRNGVFVFETGGIDGALTAINLFDVLKPELRLLQGSDILIDGVVFRNLEMRAPGQHPVGEAMEISPSNVLLDQARHNGMETAEVMAGLGGDLIGKVIRNLDVVARFSGSAFPKALLELTRRYLNEDVNPQLGGDQIGTEIDKLFRDDPIAAGRILQFLLAFEVDESSAERNLRTALEKFGFSGVEVPRKVDAVVHSVRKVRRQLNGGVEDANWVKVVRHLPWVANRTHGEQTYNIDLGDVGISVGAPLRDAYKVYRTHADHLHKFVRAPALHSCVFLWLMSKYRPLEDGNLKATADVVYERGVAQAGIKRLSGETPQNDAQRQRLADQTAQSLIKELDKKLPGFSQSATQLIGDIRDAISNIKAFTRSDLNAWLKKQYMQLIEAMPGPTGDALATSRKDIASYSAVYQNLLNALNAIDPKAWEIDAMIAEIGGVGNAQHAEALEAAKIATREAFADPVANEDEHARHARIRGKALDAFAIAFAQTSIRGYAATYENLQDEIKSNKNSHSIAYEIATRLAGGYDVVKDAAMTVNVPPPAAQAVSKAGRNKLESLITEQVHAPAPAQILLSPAFSRKIPVNQVFPIKIQNKSGEVYGFGEIRGGEGQIEFNDKVGGVDGENLLQDFSLAFSDVPPPDIAAGTVTPLIDIDVEQALVPAMEARKQHDTRRKDYLANLDELAKYSAARESLRKIYADPQNGNLTDAARSSFKLGMRALTLGEFIAAAPDSQSRLGVRTISSTLNLMLDAVRAIGKHPDANPNLVFPRPDAETSEGLDAGSALGFNMSAYARLPSGPDSAEAGSEMIHQMIIYHKQLVQSMRSVREFLQDLADLRGVAEAAPGARLIVINRTVAEYAADIREGGGEMIGRDHHAATLYISKAAKAEADGWSDVSKVFQDGYSGYIESQGLASQGLVPKFSCPMVISAEKRDDGDDKLAGCPFPAARFDSLQGLSFVPSPLNDGGESRMDSGLVVMGAPPILSLPAAMAAATIVKTQSALGSISKTPVGVKFKEEFQKASGLIFMPGEPVTGLLRRLWMQPTSNNCLGAMVMARYASLAMARDFNKENINTLGRLIVATKLERGGDAVISDKDLNAARREVFETALFGDSDQLNIALMLPDQRGRFADDNRGAPFFSVNFDRSEEEAPWIYVQTMRANDLIKIRVLAELREPLTFLNI